MFQENSENDFGLSFGDLMAALLLLFILILMSVLYQLTEQDEKKVKQLKEQEELINKFDNLQDSLYEALKVEFKDDLPTWNATIDSNDLTFRFEEPDVLFENGRSEIKQLFKDILSDFFPRYLKIITGDKFKDEIIEVRIEGHTSSKGSSDPNENYLFNLRLSQQRSAATMSYLMKSVEIDSLDKEWCKQIMTVNGLSWSKKIFKETEEGVIEDYEKSRRVEFRVKLDIDKKFRELEEIIDRLNKNYQ